MKLYAQLQQAKHWGLLYDITITVLGQQACETEPVYTQFNDKIEEAVRASGNHFGAVNPGIPTHEYEGFNTSFLRPGNKPSDPSRFRLLNYHFIPRPQFTVNTLKKLGKMIDNPISNAPFLMMCE